MKTLECRLFTESRKVACNKEVDSKEKKHMRGKGAKSTLFFRSENPRGRKPQERIGILCGLTVT